MIEMNPDEQEAAAEFIRIMKRLQVELDDVSNKFAVFQACAARQGPHVHPPRVLGIDVGDFASRAGPRENVGAGRHQAMQLPEHFGHGGFAPEPEAGELADARYSPPDGIWPCPLHGRQTSPVESSAS
jgi:hypothetical protein